MYLAYQTVQPSNSSVADRDSGEGGAGSAIALSVF